MKNKGQESMPVELLLGVTILTFVVTIGFYSYRQVCATQYDHKVRAGLDRLSRVMEQAYQGGVGTRPPAITLDTSVPPGCEVGFESVRLVDGPSDACEANIGKEECIMAVAVSVDQRGDRYVAARSYIDIPRGVIVEMEDFDVNCRADHSEIYDPEEDFDSDDHCGWGQGTFSVQVTKERSAGRDEIVIERLGN